MEAAPILCAIACSILADCRGRSALGWFFIGLFLNVIGIILLLVLGEENEESSRSEGQQKRTRKVEEQLRHERSRRQDLEREVEAARQRIDLHDQALGIETRPMNPPPPIDQRFSSPGSMGHEPQVGI